MIRNSDTPIASVATVPAELYVLGDRTQLKQVLLNLCLNSLEAMEGVGGQLRIAATQQDAQVILTLQDTGPGIPPEALAKVFEPFFTTKATGTGLGLAVVRDIVQEHGGQISLASRIGQGATATVRWLERIRRECKLINGKKCSIILLWGRGRLLRLMMRRSLPRRLSSSSAAGAMPCMWR